jgi:hypothetical protein
MLRADSAVGAERKLSRAVSCSALPTAEQRKGPTRYRSHLAAIIRRDCYRLQYPSGATDTLSVMHSGRYFEKPQSFQPEIRRRSLRHPGVSIRGASAYYLMPA